MEELVTSIEERNVIQTELTTGSEEPVRKKRRFLLEKSISARQKNPTSLDESSLSKTTGRKRRLDCLKLHVRFMEAALSRLYQGKLVYVRQLYKNDLKTF